MLWFCAVQFYKQAMMALGWLFYGDRWTSCYDAFSTFSAATTRHRRARISLTSCRRSTTPSAPPPRAAAESSIHRQRDARPPTISAAARSTSCARRRLQHLLRERRPRALSIDNETRDHLRYLPPLARHLARRPDLVPGLRDQRRRLALPHFPYVDAALPQPRYGAITLLVNLLTHSPVDHLPSQPLAHLLHGRKLLHHLPGRPLSYRRPRARPYPYVDAALHHHHHHHSASSRTAGTRSPASSSWRCT